MNNLLSAGGVGNESHRGVEHNSVSHGQFLQLALFLALGKLQQERKKIDEKLKTVIKYRKSEQNMHVKFIPGQMDSCAARKVSDNGSQCLHCLPLLMK